MSLLPSDVQQLVKDTFQQGTRWAFISLVPWAGVAFVLTLFLSNIRDTDKGATVETAEGDVQEKEAPLTPVEEGKCMDGLTVPHPQRPRLGWYESFGRNSFSVFGRSFSVL